MNHLINCFYHVSHIFIVHYQYVLSLIGTYSQGLILCDQNQTYRYDNQLSTVERVLSTILCMKTFRSNFSEVDKLSLVPDDDDDDDDECSSQSITLRTF